MGACCEVGPSAPRNRIENPRPARRLAAISPCSKVLRGTWWLWRTSTAATRTATARAMMPRSTRRSFRDMARDSVRASLLRRGPQGQRNLNPRAGPIVNKGGGTVNPEAARRSRRGSRKPSRGRVLRQGASFFVSFLFQMLTLSRGRLDRVVKLENTEQNNLCWFYQRQGYLVRKHTWSNPERDGRVDLPCRQEPLMCLGCENRRHLSSRGHLGLETETG